MISYLSGQVIDKEVNELTIVCRGVGYQVFCSQNTLDDITDRKIVQLWIHTHVKEDQLTLFGFSSKVEKKLFLSMLKVNGIGPKLAITALSGASLDTIIDAIEAKDVKGLTKLPRIGKKTAEQMILTLKGQLIDENIPQKQNTNQSQTEIISALTHLGFQQADVEEVVGRLPTSIDFESGVRKCLQDLSQV